MRIEKYLNISPIFASLLLYDAVIRSTALGLKDEALGVIDALVLVAIFMEKENVTLTRLARTFHLKASNLSQTLKYLEDKGLIMRESQKSDRRQWTLKPLPEGKKVVH